MGKNRRGMGNAAPPGSTRYRGIQNPKGQSMSKITLITGANRGLGRNTALAIARSGGDVIVAYRANAAQAEEAVAEIRALGRQAAALQLDMAETASFPAFADRLRTCLAEVWGRDSFDHLVNNAGHGEFAPIGETTESQFDGLFQVHVKGVFFLVQTLLPLLADRGRIINFSSGLTRFSFPGFAAYAAAKAAVEMLTLYMAKELGPRGITVNTVAPGAIETDFGGGVVRDNAEMNARFANLTALGRVGLPDDIGPMVASLLGDGNRWVTAQRIEVSGGQNI
ncbi:NAD(P)-dependent dehydrogenase (short-subunit alcohol dehydrogenase family) [Cereibacter changlensis]|nr:NAD(P)-dependent dehydrogenase (short-subunit alcohol dehydrogenase family) [Cereibacter changlensis]